jgi:hypothetical protein
MEFENYWVPYLRKYFKEWEFGEYGIPHDYNQIIEDRNLLSATKMNSVNLRGTIRALNIALQCATNLIEKLPSEN